MNRRVQGYSGLYDEDGEEEGGEEEEEEEKAEKDEEEVDEKDSVGYVSMAKLVVCRMFFAELGSSTLSQDMCV